MFPMSILWLNRRPKFFYLPWACQTDPNLNGWDVVYDVPPRFRPPALNEDDYEPHINPDTYEGEFFQETCLSKKVSRTALLHPRTLK